MNVTKVVWGQVQYCLPTEQSLLLVKLFLTGVSKPEVKTGYERISDLRSHVTNPMCSFEENFMHSLRIQIFRKRETELTSALKPDPF